MEKVEVSHYQIAVLQLKRRESPGMLIQCQGAEQPHKAMKYHTNSTFFGSLPPRS